MFKKVLDKTAIAVKRIKNSIYSGEFNINSSFSAHIDKPEKNIIENIMLATPTIVNPVFIKLTLSFSLEINLIMEVPMPKPDIFTMVVEADTITIARPTLCAS